MYFISRLHVASYGWRQAWYDSLTLDMRSAESDRPTDVVIQAPNGTGKTSLLGALFTIIDPSASRFLPTLANDSRYLGQYFDEAGAPALLVVELFADTPSGEVRFIVGQVGALRNPSDSREVSRQYFSFRANATAGLSFETLPGQAQGPARLATYEQALAWLRDAKQRAPENFFLTDVQATWTQHLQSNGVDVALYRKMTDFSKVEGGVDKSFLNFKTQDGFLREFYQLVLSEDRTRAVLESVAKATQDLRDKPKMEAAFAALVRLEEGFAHFVRDAKEHNQLAEQAKALAERLAAMQAALLRVVDARTAEIERLRAELAVAREGEATQNRLLALHEAQHEAWEAARHVCHVQELQHLHEDAQTALRVARLDQRAVDAALRVRHIRELQARRDDLQRLMREAASGLEPFEQAVRAEGAKLKAVVYRDIKAREATLEALTRRDDELRAQLTQQEAALRDIEARGREAMTRRLQVESQLEHADRALKRAATEGVLASADEPLDTAEARLIEAVAAAQAVLAQRVESEKAAEHLVAAVEARMTEVRTSLAQQQSTHERAKVERRAVEDKAAQLRECQALRRLGNPEQLDLLAATTENELRELHRQHLVKTAEAGLQEQRLLADVQVIEQTGLASAPEGTRAVVAHLQSKGIKSAKPHQAYLASVVPDVVRARAVIASDPARFAGVAIVDPNELARAREVDFAELALDAPVVVSQATNVASTQEREGFVVRSTQDTTYNIAAAGAALDGLRARAQSERCAAQDHSRLAVELSDALQRLAGLRALLAGRSLEDLASAEAQLFEAVTALQRQLSDQEKAREEARAALKTARADTRQAEEALSKAQSLQDKLPALRKEQAEVPALRVARTETVQRVHSLDEQREQTQARLGVLRQDRDGNAEDRRRTSTELDRLRDVANEIRYAGDVTAELKELVRINQTPLEDQRTAYQRAEQAYTTKQSDKVAVLKAQDDGLNAQLGRAKADFQNMLVEGLSEPRVMAFVHRADLDSEKANAREAVLAAEQAEREAMLAHAEGQTLQRHFDSHRKHPESVCREWLFDATACHPFEGGRAAVHLSCEGAIADLADLNTATCETHVVVHDKARALAFAAAEAAEQAVRLLHAGIQSAEKELDELQRTRKRTQKFSGESLQVPHDEAAVAEALPMGVALAGALEDEGERYQQLEKQRMRAQTAAATSYQAFTARLGEPAIVNALAANVHAALMSNTLDAACDHAEHVADALRSRRETLGLEIERLMGDFERTAREVELLSEEAIERLKAAVSKKVPAGVPVYEGHPMLKVSQDVFGITPEERRSRIAQYLDRLLQDRPMPVKGGDLAAEAVLAVAGVSSLNVRILKASQHMSVEYCPVHAIPSSGGEKAVAAVMLWAIVGRLKRDNGRQGNAPIGALVVDNLFSQVTFEPLLRLLRSMANALGLQCVLTNLYEDRNITAAFERVLYLRTSKTARKSGRNYVELAHSQLLAPVKAEQQSQGQEV